MRVNIASWVMTLDWKKQKNNVRLRIVADSPFVAKDDNGLAVLVEGSPQVFREVDVTIADVVVDGVPTTQITVPAMWLFSTNDALKHRTTARYSAFLVSKSGAILDQIDTLQSFIVPLELLDLNNPTSWTEIIKTNSPAAPVPWDRETFSREQILSLLGQFTGINALITREVDGSPLISPTSILEFNQADGFTLTPMGLGVARVGFTVPGLSNKLDKIGSSTDNAVVRWDGTTGSVVQNSVVTIADSTGNMAGVGTLNTHTIPGGTDTFALLAAAQTLTNKSILASSNSLGGVTMALGSDATGDIYYRNSGGQLARLPVGSNGQVLTLAAGLPSWAAAAGGAPLTVKEIDGAPTVNNVTTIQVTNGTLTDNGGGVVTVVTGGGGGGGTPGGASGSIQFNNGGSFGGEGADLFYDSTNNRVGMGTSTPTAFFDIRNDTAVDFAIGNIATTRRARLSMTTGSVQPFVIDNNSGGGINLSMSGTAVFTDSAFGEVVHLPIVRTSGTVTGWRWQTPADNYTTTPVAEVRLMQFGGDASAASVTRTGDGAWNAGQRDFVFVHTTYAPGINTATNPAATVAITNQPGGATGNNAYALWVQAGRTRLAGDIIGGGSFDLTGTINVGADANVTGNVAVTGQTNSVGLLSCDTGASLDVLGTTAVITLASNPGAYLDATAEVNDWFINLARTVNFTGGSAIANQRSIFINAPTFNADGARTLTKAATVAITGAPVASTNITITTALALSVESGNVMLGTAGSNQPQLFFTASGNSNLTSFSSGDSPAGSVQYKWPADTPAAGEQLTVTSFSGGVAVLEWAAAGSGGGGAPGGSTGDFQINAGGGSFGAGVIVQGSNGRVIASPTLTSSGALSYFRIVTPADTGQTADTEFPGIFLGGNSSGATVTRTGADGTTYALQREIIAPAVTYAFAGATTVTLAVGADFNSPIQGSNATLTNSVAVRANPSATAHLAFLAAHSNTNSTGAFFTGTTGGTNRIQILPFNLGGSRVGGWIDMSTTGPSGIGHGGVGTHAWIAYADTGSAYLTDAAVGDIVYRNTAGRLLFGTSTGNSNLALSGNNVGVNKSASLTATLDVVGLSSSQTTFQIVSAANSTVDLVKFGLIADDTTTVANLASFNAISNGTAGAGFGQSLAFNLESNTTNDRNASNLVTKWNVATDASRTAHFQIGVVGNATFADRFSLLPSDGTFVYHRMVMGEFEASAARNNLFTTTSGTGNNIAGSEMNLAGGQSTGSGTSGFVGVVMALQQIGAAAGDKNGYGGFTYPVALVMGAKNATTTLTGTSEATIQGTLTGTDTLGAGEARTAMTIVAEYYGILTTDASPGTITVRVKVNGTTQLTLTSTTLPTGATNIPVHGKWMITIRSLGATGTAFIQGFFHHQISNADQYWQGQTTTTFTFDTTADATFDVTGQFSDTGNSLSITNGVLNMYMAG